MEKNAQTYIATAVIISALIITFAFFLRTAVMNPHKTVFLMENVKVEMPSAYIAGIYLDDANTTLYSTALEFREFAKEKQQPMKLAFIASLQDKNSFVFGNFWGEDCNYYNARMSGGPIADGSTAIISKQTLKNNYNITFCGKSFSLQSPKKKGFQFYVEIRTGTDVSRWDNTDKPL